MYTKTKYRAFKHVKDGVYDDHAYNLYWFFFNSVHRLRLGDFSPLLSIKLLLSFQRLKIKYENRCRHGDKVLPPKS